MLKAGLSAGFFWHLSWFTCLFSGLRRRAHSSSDNISGKSNDPIFVINPDYQCKSQHIILCTSKPGNT